VPIVALSDPLTAQLNLGGVDVLDTAGAMGAAGTVLSSLGAGAGTAWVAGGGGVVGVNAGTNITIPNPAVPIVALSDPLTAQLNLGIVDVLDTAGAMGAVGTVLSSLGAGAGTSWVAGGGGTSYPVAFVPYFFETALPNTSNTINQGGGGLYTTADLLRGSITPTVAQLYDPAAVVPTGATLDTLELELHLEMVIPAAGFIPTIPTAQLINDDINNNIQALTGQPAAPVQIVYHWTYTTPTTPPGTYLDFTTPQFYSSIFTAIPKAVAVAYPFGAQAFSTQLSARTLINIAGLVPADVITFQLWAYTQDTFVGGGGAPPAPPKIIDTTPAGITPFGIASLKSSMFRL
jgi:hypothetical protein